MNLLEAHGGRRPGQDRRLPGAGRPDRRAARCRATSPSACVPRPGAWSSRRARAACRSTSPWSRSSAPTASSTAPATSRARPANVIVRVSGPRHGAQGRHDLRDHRPAARARLRHRHRRAPLRLTQPGSPAPGRVRVAGLSRAIRPGRRSGGCRRRTSRRAPAAGRGPCRRRAAARRRGSPRRWPGRRRRAPSGRRVPWITSAGIRSARSRWERLGWVRIASIWRSTPLALTAAVEGLAGPVAAPARGRAGSPGSRSAATSRRWPSTYASRPRPARREQHAAAARGAASRPCACRSST